ncbi:unnamed protein product [Cyberlindnera jadinii]|uniref:Uncharacterized protein n=1 Tax=Cyberlindnera jadinii (strain ATCC 18201 / CBS 1600 / BCRC 20928 / JCM 3617 / NBRC 0987 / NRRL Y-1542) TaxID=983966 RepID=A0A0H5C7G2_CYBJN|nr:unnamed protein product [Cyberlindnera jadinii]
MSAQYNCQRCHLPLVIDSSLTNLTKAQGHLLTSGRLGYGRDRDDNGEKLLGNPPFIPAERQRRLDRSTSNVREPALVDWRSDGDSFVILPQFEGQDEEREDDDDVEDKIVSTRVKMLSSIFNLLSSKGDLDYPVCGECAKLLIESMKLQYDQVIKERDAYVQFLQKLENRPGQDTGKLQDTMDHINDLKGKEGDLLKELQGLEAENDQLDDEIVSLEKELETIDKEEQQFQMELNRQAIEVDELIKERDTVTAEYKFNLLQLEKLRKTNVYSDTFNISHDGPFATINGLRLGSLDGIRVPWREINSALGQVILLLATITTRLNFKLVGYKLKPMGSTSKIEKYEPDPSNPSKPKVTILEAYSSGDYQIERLFNHSNLDNSLVAILDILSQISNHLQKYDTNIELPYKMVNHKIGEASIRLGSKVADDEWTSACKFLLTNTKWILAYSSAHIPLR